MVNLGKKEIVDIIAKNTDMNKVMAGKAYDAVFQTIVEEIVKGNGVTVRGFGTFSLNEVGERKSFSVAARQMITVPAHKRLNFKPANQLRDIVK